MIDLMFRWPSFNILAFARFPKCPLCVSRLIMTTTVWRLKGIPVVPETLADRQRVLQSLDKVANDDVEGGFLYTYFHSHLTKNKSTKTEEWQIKTGHDNCSADDHETALADFDEDFTKWKAKAAALVGLPISATTENDGEEKKAKGKKGAGNKRTAKDCSGSNSSTNITSSIIQIDSSESASRYEDIECFRLVLCNQDAKIDITELPMSDEEKQRAIQAMAIHTTLIGLKDYLAKYSKAVNENERLATKMQKYKKSISSQLECDFKTAKAAVESSRNLINKEISMFENKPPKNWTDQKSKNKIEPFKHVWDDYAKHRKDVDKLLK